MAKMECPICGQVFNEENMKIADNGNLVCCNCAEKEKKYRRIRRNNNE